MFDVDVEGPLSFEQIAAQEHRFIRPSVDPTQPQPLAALCISGGGIRCATFAAGVIQGLAEKDVLDIFHYLSTVSGGGYIGSWLTAWKQRRGGLDRIIPALKPAAASPPKSDPDPIQHLREYSNYLSPKLGFFSADTWTLAATIARNMLLNWLIIVPLLMFVLMAPRLLLSLARFGESLRAANGLGWQHHVEIEYALGTLSALSFATAACNALRYLPGVGKINHTETAFLRFCMLPLICAGIAFITLESWFTGGEDNLPPVLTYGELIVSITASQLAGWIGYLIFHVRKHNSTVIIGLTIALVFTGFSTATFAWFLVSKVYPSMEWETYIALAPPLLFVAFALPIVLFVGVTSDYLQDEDREWLSRAGAWLLLFVLVWAGVCTLVLWVPVWVFDLGDWGRLGFAAIGCAGGVVTALGGFSRKSKVSSSTPERRGEATSTSSARIRLLLQVAATVFVIVFTTGLAILTNLLLVVSGLVQGDWTDHWQLVEDTRTRSVFLAALAFVSIGWLMARFVDINKFSLHAMYRNRLIRAYVGASNRHDQVNQFIGFANNDDLLMRELNPELLPFHVVNVTLNVVSGRRLAWQQRKAESFTITPLHCGSSYLGYRCSDKYADGISLGTAMTLSGAAASPNMGYYSSPLVGFIMTLFNARLGAWLGNPGEYGKSTWRRQGPKSAVTSIVREAFGLTTEEGPYIYLSDGGHFENLGVYEMVRRCCRFIVVVDGSADLGFKFESLGNALRKIRVDTKVDITFDEQWADEMRVGKKRWAVARICYQDAGLGEDGCLIYIKPMICGTEPPDVLSYSASNSDFPHQRTTNQFFNESQTESYRMLGLHTIREMLSDCSVKSFQAIEEHVRKAAVKKQTPFAAAAAGE